METSDSEPDHKRPKVDYNEQDVADYGPQVDYESNFSLGDFVFSSDEESIGRRIATELVKSNDFRCDSSDSGSKSNLGLNNEDMSGDDEPIDPDDNSNSKPNSVILSVSDMSSNSEKEKPKTSWSDGSVDFETDKESSEDYVVSPFSAISPSPDIDIDNFSDSSDSENHRMYDVEFEVASVSENNDNPIEDANSSSAVDEPVNNEDMPRYEPGILDDDRDTDNFADGEIQLSDAESDPTRKTSRLNTSDSELSDKDKFLCTQCGARSQPYFRHCLRCFRIRRNWLPKRTKPRRAKRKKASKNANVGTEAESEPVPSTSRDSFSIARINDTRSDTPKPPPSDDSSKERMMQSFLKNLVPGQPEDADNIDTVDGPTKRVDTVIRGGILTPPSSNLQSQHELDSQSCSSSNKPTVNMLDPPESPLSPLLPPQSTLPNQQNPSYSAGAKNGINLKLLQSLKSALEDPVKIDVVSSTPVTNKEETHSSVPMCNLCCVREKDAAFVHNKIAHHFCCFVCADKILKKNGKCPICRDRVFRVVKIISV